MERREFLFGAGALAASAALPEISGAQTIQVEKEGLSILQGLTTETSTQLSVDVPVKTVCHYSLQDVETGAVVDPVAVEPVTFGSSDTRVDKVKFNGLQLGHRYQLFVKDGKNKILDDRYLSTVDLNKTGARVAIMSCMNDGKSAHSEIWPSAEAADLDYLFFIGDNVYGDFWFLHGPSRLWSRYVSTRRKLSFYHWKNLKPVIAVWDDHDFGKNNEDGTYKYKDYSYHIFKTFFAQDPDGKALWNGYGNSCFFQAFNQNFVFFDSRYYRALPNPDGTLGFMGHDQINWMSEAISSRSRPTLLLQGAPYFGRSDKESSYHHHAAEELEYFLGKVRSWNMPVMFGGGDLHFSEISKIDRSLLGFETYELISSCMHSNTKSKFYENPNPQVQGYLKENFLVLEQIGLKGDPVWRVTCVGKKKIMPFETVLEVG